MVRLKPKLFVTLLIVLASSLSAKNLFADKPPAAGYIVVGQRVIGKAIFVRSQISENEDLQTRFPEVEFVIVDDYILPQEWRERESLDFKGEIILRVRDKSYLLPFIRLHKVTQEYLPVGRDDKFTLDLPRWSLDESIRQAVYDDRLPEYDEESDVLSLHGYWRMNDPTRIRQTIDFYVCAGKDTIATGSCEIAMSDEKGEGARIPFSREALFETILDAPRSLAIGSIDVHSKWMPVANSSTLECKGRISLMSQFGIVALDTITVQPSDFKGLYDFTDESKSAIKEQEQHQGVTRLLLPLYFQHQPIPEEIFDLIRSKEIPQK